MKHWGQLIGKTFESGNAFYCPEIWFYNYPRGLRYVDKTPNGVAYVLASHRVNWYLICGHGERGVWAVRRPKKPIQENDRGGQQFDLQMETRPVRNSASHKVSMTWSIYQILVWSDRDFFCSVAYWINYSPAARNMAKLSRVLLMFTVADQIKSMSVVGSDGRQPWSLYVSIQPPDRSDNVFQYILRVWQGAVSATESPLQQIELNCENVEAFPIDSVSLNCSPWSHRCAVTRSSTPINWKTRQWQARKPAQISTNLSGLIEIGLMDVSR